MLAIRIILYYIFAVYMYTVLLLFIIRTYILLRIIYRHYSRRGYRNEIQYIHNRIFTEVIYFSYFFFSSARF